MDRLAQMSRRSPLAPWCFFVRALDAYYHFEDARAKAFLDRIPDGIALSPAKTVLISKLNGRHKPDTLSSKPTRDLWKALTQEGPRTAWFDLMRTIETENPRAIRAKVRQTLQADWLASPYKMRAATQSIREKMFDAAFCDSEIERELIHTIKMQWGEKGELITALDAQRIYGRVEPFEAAEFLELLDEKWEKSLSKKERAMILAQAAELYKVDEVHYSRPFSFFDSPPEMDHEDSINVYKKVCRLDPRPEYFRPLLTLLREDGRKLKEIESLLTKWCKTNPTDCEPWIHLFEDAEKRGALQKSLKFLEEAERLDRLNQNVRDARHRLVWQMALKHFKQKKFHLVERDLNHIRSNEIPPVKQALFNGLERFLLLCQDESDPGAGESHPVFDAILLRHLNNLSNAGLDKKLDCAAPLGDLDEGSKLQAYYDLREALETVRDTPYMSSKWFEQFPGWIAEARGLTDDLLLRISKTILTNGIPEVVIAATARGLEKDTSRIRDYLFYRALALWKDNPYEEWDVEECLRAVVTLCRARGDYELERQAIDALQNIRRHQLSVRIFEEEESGELELELEPEELSRVIQRERERFKPLSPQEKRRAEKARMKKAGKELLKLVRAFEKAGKLEIKQLEEEFAEELDDLDEIIEEENDKDDLQPLLW